MKFFKPIAIAFLVPLTFGLSEVNAKNPTSLISEARTILKQDTLSWDAKLPFDNEVITGVLANGFKYYIRKNVQPEKRVTMYLGVKVGSILENENELGLAHFLEHMNFNGLKHFPKNALVDYLQKAGVRFGSDLNAYTGFDETVYQLPIPSDDPELLKNGLQVMRDWAQDALLATDEINKERGVVMEEMRGKRGAGERMREKYFPVLLNGSRYTNRLPIGTEEIITKFDPKVIREFHKNWYRPDLQSIIIVGDVDVKHIESEVKRLFSDLKSPKKILPRKEYKVDLLNKNQFLIVTDPEETSVSGEIYLKFQEEKVNTVKDYRSNLLKNAYNQMISIRLREIIQSANPPFLEASVGLGGFIAGLDVLSISFTAKPGLFEEGFKAVIKEVERVDQFGFTNTEFQRFIVNMTKSNENSYIERDKRSSDSYVKSYLNHFLKGNAALSNEDRYQITKQLLPTLTLAEVNEIAKKYYTDINRDVLITAPEKEKESLPNENLVNTWFNDLKKEKLTAYEDKVSELPLLTKSPVKGSIVSEKDIAEIGAKELVLSNGIKVILKPTAFKNNQILIYAFSPGGTSLYNDKDYLSASNASGFVNYSGLGQLNNIELQKYMTGKNVNISPILSERSEGISGSSDKEGLKTAFELIYGYFNEPRIEDDVFQSAIQRTLSSFENRESDPSFVFSESVSKALYNNNIRRVPANKEKIEQVDKTRALEIFKERFADASDFTFTLVGSFTEEEIKPYLEEYLASLPNLNRKEEAKDLGIYEPAKGFEKIVHMGKEAKADVTIAYYGDYAYNDTENLNIKALESTLSIKLLQRLREKESGVYNVGAHSSVSKSPKNRFNFNISFGTGLDKYQSLITSVIDEVNIIKSNGPTQEDLDKFKIEQKRQLETQMRDNGFWLGQIVGAYQKGEDPTYILRYLEELDKVNINSVKEVANKYLKEDQLFKFILLPEEVK